MLILSRKVEESITLDLTVANHDRKVVIKVLDVKGGIVRLGVEADSTVLIERTQDD